MKKLKYGIIGTGNIAMGKHLPGYAALNQDVEIVAACDINMNALDTAAKKFNIPKITTDYKELLTMDEIDFVSICLPNYLHAPVAIEALNAGKHVHCEKPMAMNTDEAKSMLEARNSTGKKLMVGLNNRFTPQARYAKSFIEEGHLGEIYFAKCGWLRRAGLAPYGWFTDKSKSGGGPLIDLGVHYIDLVMYFMNYPSLKSVTSRTYCKFGNSQSGYLYNYDGKKPGTEDKFDVEDLAAGFIELKNDASISFEISWASNIENEKVYYELYGTKGGLKFEHVFSKTLKPELKVFTTISGQQIDIIPQINPALYKETEFMHFINCIREDKQPTISIPEQGVDMMKIIDGIYQSEKQRKQVIF